MTDEVLTPDLIALLNDERNDREFIEQFKKANSAANIQEWLEAEISIQSIIEHLHAGTADTLTQKIAAGWIEAKLKKPRRGPKGKSRPWSFRTDLFWASHATDHIVRYWKQRRVHIKLDDAIKSACQWVLGPNASETAITNLAGQVRDDRKRSATRSFRRN